MLTRSLAVVGLVVGAALSVGCGGGEDAVEDATGALNGGAEQAAARTTSGAVDADKGTANLTVSFTIKGGTVAALKTKIADPSLGLWKGLKRPAEVKLSDKETIKMPHAGSALFGEMKREGSKIDAFMPFSDSGLLQFSGLDLRLSFDVADTSSGFTLKVTNREKVETRLLKLDVVEKEKLSFELSAAETEGGVAVTISETVELVRGKDRAGRLLGFSVAVADALETK